MKTKQFFWRPGDGWQEAPESKSLAKVSLVIIFGATEVIVQGECVEQLKNAFPEATMIGCTTGGEIFGTSIHDGSLVATAISFDSASVLGKWISVHGFGDSREAAAELIEQFPQKGLRHIFILADGVLTNPSELVRGINDRLPPSVSVTGGMAGDGLDFSSSYILLNGEIQQATIAAVGFYGDGLTVGYGSCGGWIPFGPQRMITASEGNTMYELDGQSVLDLYKAYLGKDAEKLPAAGLLFPLSVTMEDDESAVVRTVRALDEEKGSLNFVGDVPTGCYAQFMRAVPDDLIDGAAEAAKIARRGGEVSPELCILISCIGRKAVLKQLSEEETEAVGEVFPHAHSMIGFYSYGEIAPLGEGSKITLHNQTMTLMTLAEKKDA